MRQTQTCVGAVSAVCFVAVFCAVMYGGIFSFLDMTIGAAVGAQPALTQNAIDMVDFIEHWGLIAAVATLVGWFALYLANQREEDSKPQLQ